MELKNDIAPVKKYNSFEDTFKLCTFFLACAFMYPNKNNIMKRFVLFTLLSLFNSGQVFWFTIYTFKCLYALDLYNFSRNMTLAVIVGLYFLKTYYVILTTRKFAPLLSIITEDLLEANNLDAEYQSLYDEHIKLAKVAEFSWLIIPIMLSVQFPLYAGILMSYESIQTDDYEKRMVHHMDLLFIEDIQSEAPFFHCIFVYNFIQSVVLIPNYCGLDGSFCIATTHLRLKLKLMALKVQKAYKTAQNVYELRLKVREAIRDHQNALEFYDRLQDIYGPWLFAVFMLTSFMISFNLYQIHLLRRIDPKYTSFGLAGVLHIYLPCYYASTLTQVGEETSDELYLAPWEKWADPVTTKLLIFMICRAQKKLILTGSGVVVFNMELFKTIMQTSYSFFTLITA